jgi:hypothetical protein
MLLRASEGLRFNEDFFLFYEDDAICAVARAKGRALVLVPDAVLPRLLKRYRPSRHGIWPGAGCITCC